MYNKKVLVFSNQCFSLNTANGRTLGNLFACLDKENLAQFFVSGEPDYDMCANYFQVTDGQAKESFLNGEKQTGNIISRRSNNSAGGKSIERTPLTMILRDIIWNSNRWKGVAFYEWVEKFKPDVIVIQAGDNGFMFKLALDTAKKYEVPIVVYNTEGHYFKKHNFINPSTNKFGWLFPLFRYRLRKIMKKTDKYTKCYVHLNDKIKEEYDTVFKKPSYVIYNSSNLRLEPKEVGPKVVFSYLGDINHGRAEALIKIAKVLNTIEHPTEINVYGRPWDVEDAQLLSACTEMNYKGFVPYAEVINAMRQSDVLIAVDTFIKEDAEDVKYGFSCKIADSLFSNRVFFAYEPEYTAISEYMKSNNVGVVVNNENQLRDALLRIVVDYNYRKDIANKQLLLAIKNHDLLVNSKKMLDILFKNSGDMV